MTDGLHALLLDHPFDDADGLLFTADRTVTAGEARAAAHAAAARLAAAGVSPGEAVAVRLPNGPEVVTAMTGIWEAGAVFVPVNPRLADKELAAVLAATGPVALIDVDGVHDLRRQGDAAPARRYEPGAAFILWTSGTTGAPRPIIHTHQGYLELLDRVLGPLRARPAGSDQPARPPMPNLIPVQMSLNAGIYNALFGLRAGAPLVIMDRFSPATFAQLVRRFAIRSTVLPPAAIAELVGDPGLDDLSPLTYVRSITAPLSVLHARKFSERFGVFVLNSYGQAEVGEVIGWTAADAKAHPEKLGAAGRPHPGVGVKVVAHPGGTEPLPAGTVGELLVRPPSMAAGYASGSALGDRIDDQGYLRTGDLARLDEDGFVWIEGRAGDLINRGGNKVFPEQVEEVLCLLPGVAEAAVVGVPEDRLGEVPVAFVVLGPEDGPQVTDDDLRQWCREQLTPYKVPVDFVRTAALPRNDAGKVLRRQLAAGYRLAPEEDAG